MTWLTGTFVAFTLVLGLYLWLAASPWRRLPSAVLVAFGLLLAVTWLGGAELLARPKPIHLEWRAPDQVEVLAARLFEGRAIYLWLALAGESEPRAYVLPWDQQQAEELYRALRAGGQERGVVMRRPFGTDKGRDYRPRFHPPPQEAPTSKHDQGTPELFRRPQ